MRRISKDITSIREILMPLHAVFRATELMDMAISIEEEGQAFYRVCLSTTDDARMKGVFQYLLDQEIEHARTFSRMKGNLNPDESLPESYPGELRNYLNAFVKGEVFDDPKTAQDNVQRLKDENEIIAVALELEKQSILFYSGMKLLVRHSDAEEVDRIITQEHRHVRRLHSFRQERIEGQQGS
jgi:rubrerythrin